MANRGITQIVQSLREIGEHVEEAAKEALKAGAERIVVTAKQRCPVKTGKLKSSIEAKSEREGAIQKVKAEAKNKKGFNYAPIVEYSPKINRPFISPSLEEHRAEIYAEIKEAIRKAINEGGSQ